MSKIRILEEDSNKRGDLFGRLIGDLFLSLGYENPRLNIHKSGREIDVDAIHRMEKRRVIAECKATQDKIGGADINKFVGSLNAEQIKEKSLETIGYYVSLSGFRETAIEQEKELGFSRIIMLDWNDIVKELVKGKIIISPEKAVERAGRCASTQPSDLVLEKCELLAHSVGWIWAIYYSQNKQNTTFCLVHADGEVLSKGLYKSIVEADKKNGGELYSLKGLLPFEKSYIDTEKIEDVKRGYFKYLLHECGDIRLDGLPADGEIGSRRLNLESIFVPLHLVPLKEYTDKQEITEVVEETEHSVESEGSINSMRREKFNERKAVGGVLGDSSRLTILAGPGGGKSTLLKRIAISYAFPERKKIINDRLPDRPWFPLFIRCRQLDFYANTSIMDILLEIPHRAEMGYLTNEFAVLVNQVLQNGNALILVDGIDEIADESLRVAFVHQLRVFLATYPKTNIVITSRKAGFRIIGGALIPHCKHYELAEFDSDDVKRLTISWHKEVVGDKQDVYIEAKKLADSICDSYRLMNLAKNPLLLTTLLLVKRWVGQLPTRRSVLYGKAIEVLLMTWNVEGHEPLDQEEVIPQLSYVAYSMMLDGVQSISLKRLKELLISARKQMPEILGYTKMSVQEMIDRVESRSSLLVLNGHEIEGGTLYPMYEFQHLTFQEYLASKAIVEGYYLNQSDKDTLWSLLQPHLKDESWKEVIALALVLSGRKVQPVVKELLLLIKEETNNRTVRETDKVTNLLLQSILDEIHISPDLLQECFEWICKRSTRKREFTKSLLHSKYRDLFIKTTTDLYFSSTSNMLSIGGIFADITFESINLEYGGQLKRKGVERALSMLSSEDLKEVNKGLLISMGIFYRCNHRYSLEKFGIKQEDLNEIRDKILTLVHMDNTHVVFGSLWALSWCFYKEQLISSNDIERLFIRVIELWKNTDSSDVEYVANWLLTQFPIRQIPKDYLIIQDTYLQQFILEKYSLDKSTFINKFAKDACFVLGFYCENEYLKKECFEEYALYLEDQEDQEDRLEPNSEIKDIAYIMESLKEEFGL
ncbi:NACHT domain-containing protein [Bacillus cereus]|uniref:NACHT domain-containing protein n=1 Tax=Bacillus cereus TaxID=1396 RepID=UPI0020D2679E|nr:NACHT domain-containing protein [Bacillus cereus]